MDREGAPHRHGGVPAPLRGQRHSRASARAHRPAPAHTVPEGVHAWGRWPRTDASLGAAQATPDERGTREAPRGRSAARSWRVRVTPEPQEVEHDRLDPRDDRDHADRRRGRLQVETTPGGPHRLKDHVETFSPALATGAGQGDTPAIRPQGCQTPKRPPSPRSPCGTLTSGSERQEGAMTEKDSVSRAVVASVTPLAQRSIGTAVAACVVTWGRIRSRRMCSSLPFRPRDRRYPGTSGAGVIPGHARRRGADEPGPFCALV